MSAGVTTPRYTPLPADRAPAEVERELLARWEDELAPHYQTARRMLGAAPTNFLTPADSLLKRIAEERGTPEAFAAANSSTFFMPVASRPRR